MSLSECAWCGGHIPLGPDASNRCEKCGKPVLSGPESEQRSLELEVAKHVVMEKARADAAVAERDLWKRRCNDGWTHPDEVAVETNRLRAERDQAKAELAELDDLVSHIYAADMRGIKLWQDEKPGRELTWPDRAQLVKWLLDRLDATESRERRLRIELFRCVDALREDGLTDSHLALRSAQLLLGEYDPPNQPASPV